MLPLLLIPFAHGASPGSILNFGIAGASLKNLHAPSGQIILHPSGIAHLSDEPGETRKTGLPRRMRCCSFPARTLESLGTQTRTLPHLRLSRFVRFFRHSQLGA